MSLISCGGIGFVATITSGFTLIRRGLVTRKREVLSEAHTLSSNVGGYHLITIIVVFVVVLLTNALSRRKADMYSGS